ncbi:MAG: glutamine amidotransferase [Kiritimatiellaeota bacterium]|nr:glutamine amidotransferase [Kiritimatiellota bacterium]
MIIYEHSLPTMAIGLGVAAAMALSVFGYGRYVQRTLPMALMAATRIFFLALLTWCLVLPGQRETQTLKHKPRFAVLLDTSRSMLMTAPKETTNRWAVVQQALQQPWVEALARDCDLEYYSFATDLGKKLTPAEVRPLTPDGTATLLRDVLKKTVSRYTGLDVTGCLLLSDGIDTREVFSDWAAEARPFPIHTLVLEGAAVWEQEPDVRIDTVNTPRRVTVGWQTELKAIISGQGTQGRNIPVQLFKDDVLQQELQTQIPAGGGSKEVVFHLEHPVAGLKTYRVLVPPFPKETRTNDNEFALSVLVVDAKNRLLYVEGPPRWESKYLSRVLRASKQVTPVIFLRGAQGKFMTFGVQGEVAPEMREAQLAFFKMVVLGNLDGEELGEERARNLVRFVETGGSLVLLGGSKAWSEKGFAQTALKKLLPAKQYSSKAVAGEFPIALTDMGRLHPAFAGDPALWQTIPPVLSLFPNVAPTPGARVLVAAQATNGPQPMILSQDYGQGKVVAIFTDSLWRWQLSPETARHNPYQRFWDQLLSWLSPKEEKSAEKELESFVDREQLFVGEDVEISARWSSAAQPPANAAVGAEVVGPDKRPLRFAMNRQVAQTSEGQAISVFTYKFKAAQAGLFAVVAVSEIGGKQVSSDPVSFSVKPFTPESVPRPVNNQVLQSISQNSGGQFFESVDALNQHLIALHVQRIEQEISEYHSLWQRGIILLLLILLLAVEWIYRKLKFMP